MCPYTKLNRISGTALWFNVQPGESTRAVSAVAAATSSEEMAVPSWNNTLGTCSAAPGHAHGGRGGRRSWGSMQANDFFLLNLLTMTKGDICVCHITQPIKLKKGPNPGDLVIVIVHICYWFLQPPESDIKSMPSNSRVEVLVLCGMVMLWCWRVVDHLSYILSVLSFRGQYFQYNTYSIVSCLKAITTLELLAQHLICWQTFFQINILFISLYIILLSVTHTEETSILLQP